MKRTWIKALYWTAGILALGTILPGFLPTQVTIHRSTEVALPISHAYRFMSDLQQFSSWSPFQELDPDQKTQIEGTGAGATLAWQSTRMGEGKMFIESLEPESKIRIRMEFYSPMPGTGVSTWELRSVDPGSTEVTWQFEQELPYFQRYFGLMMDRMLGGHFEKGLANLKLRLAAPIGG